MHVVRDGSKMQVAQLGPDFLLLEEGDDFEGPAQVILSVDGVTHSRDVQLHRKDNLVPINGSHHSSRFVRATAGKNRTLRRWPAN
jgi:hypothetical protein